MFSKPHIQEDTIAAIATPMGSGGIGIIRISGPEAFKIGKELFKRKGANSHGTPFKESTPLPRTLQLGHIVNPETQRIVDQVLVCFMPGPQSYTCEDVVEIQAHSGQMVLGILLELVINHGARLAEPGEFTRRAFLSGRIDLTQAEAIMDIVHAKTEKSLQLAAAQLKGGLREEVESIVTLIVRILGAVEAAIDFPEETEEIIQTEEISFGNVIRPLKALLKNYNEGHMLRDGVRLVILGKPNVGKSSLLNRLLKKDRAIVTAFPGTTRDTIEEIINIKGLPVILVDTAGIRQSTDPIESIGIERTRLLAEKADLILFMIDAGAGVTELDTDIFQEIRSKNTILVINKIDLEADGRATAVPESWGYKESVRTTILYDKGIDELKDIVFKHAVGAGGGDTSQIVPNLRQKGLIKRALSAALTAETALAKGVSPEFIAIDLREALGELNKVVGRNQQQDILDEIFNRYCIGK